MIKKIMLVVGISVLLSACLFHSWSQSALFGMTQDEVRSSYGKPEITRTEEPNQMWTYHQGKCTILVYFNEDKTVQFVDFSGDC